MDVTSLQFLPVSTFLGELVSSYILKANKKDIEKMMMIRITMLTPAIPPLLGRCPDLGIYIRYD